MKFYGVLFVIIFFMIFYKLMLIFLSMLEDMSLFCADGKYLVSEKDGSNFAKEVCLDYNPIHDEGNLDFAVPGDLLLSLFVWQNGLPCDGSVAFKKPVKGDLELKIDLDGISNSGTDEELVILKNLSSIYLTSIKFYKDFMAEYCLLSGSLFPEKLGEVFSDSGLMPGVEKPLVMYSGVDFDLNMDKFSLYDCDLSLNLGEINYKVLRKNMMKIGVGVDVLIDDENVGSLTKNLVCFETVPFSEAGLSELVTRYSQK